ncbi:NAD(P)/FAD-dependent oxidoreductase [Rhizobium sp. BK068]|uniref:FAD/NAD(P)-dependent oxidoreductase n=1 Tax=Rhizobium sp. BK068 TaxID=2512130 RepID=UPI001045FD76|nr:NAD(P)/FAD-dependent oxidoreductase [Rhizobium sp. BK068]TCM67853.1 NADPH-dependent 2,4-dienoyl-CoA reductase/sulfur reductase-like enzyme [Rhizobium sp. BK068]
MDTTPVIIGAGPAGIAAAAALAQCGLRPVVIDEAAQPGGQIFRHPRAELKRTDDELYGFDARRAVEFRDGFAALAPKIDYRPETHIWSACEGKLHVVSRSGPSVQNWSHLIIATGAMDRIVPVKGWTAPGVYSLGGAQIALKAEASLIGQRVVFAGTGPLLYLVAYQYAKAGATVVAVLEVGNPFGHMALLPALASGRTAFTKGLFYMATLRRRGVPLLTGVRLIEVLRGADDHVTGIAYHWRGRDKVATCDGLAIGHGLKAETQIADLLGLEFSFDPVQRQWLPHADRDGRSSMANVYLAGDGFSIRGSETAQASGRLAAAALLRDSGHIGPIEIGRDRRTVARTARFRKAMDQIFAFPHRVAAALSDDVLVCRCEGLTAGTVRQAVAASGEAEINRIKAFCRVGMGRCQGRLCGASAAELIASAAGVGIETVGRLRAQAPIKPVTLADLTGGEP